MTLTTPEVATTTTPYVFVDVDGVLNAFGILDEPHQHRVLTVGPGQYDLFIRDAVLDWLRLLCDVADVRWATTWQDHANEVLAPAFSLPELPVACRDVDQHGYALAHGTWKLAGVLATLADDPRPFVWIDDEAIPHDVDDHLAELDVPYLCVRPDPDLGLTDDQIAEIDAFLAGQR